LTIFVLVMVGALLLPKMYFSNAAIRIDPNQHQALNPDALTSGAPPDQALVDTEVAIMKSRTVAKAVVDQLHLAKDPEYNPPPNFLSNLFPKTKTNVGDPDDGLIDALAKHVTIARDGTTYVVGLKVRSTDPEKAALIANTMAEQYIATSIEARTSNAAKQANWFGGRLESYGQAVKAADAAVARYKAEHGITTTSAQTGTVTDQQIAGLATQLATAESDAAAAHSNLQSAQSQIASGGIDSVSSVLSSPVIADLRRQRAEVDRERADIASRYGPKHPEYIKVQQQIDGLDRQIHEEERRTVANLQSLSNAAAARAASLRSQLNGLKGQQGGNAEANVQADALQREADAKRAVYTQLAQSAQQSGQEQHTSQSQATIVEQATAAAKPGFPNKPLFAVLGVLLGGMCGLGAVVLAEMLSRGVRTVEDVESGLGLPFVASVPQLTRRQLGSLPAGRRAPWDFISAKPMSGYAESFRAVRSALKLSGGKGKVIAVTSTLPNEGKTTFTVGLGRVMGMSGDRVIIVDCDLRRNTMASVVKAAPGGGLIEVLSGETPVDEAIVRDSVDGVDVLPLRRVAFTPQDMIGGEAMKALLKLLAARYDYVVLDAPPMLAVADARALAKLADNVLLIVRWNRTPRQAIRAALRRLAQDGASTPGVVLSRVDTNAGGALSEQDPTFYYGAYRAYYQE
jgi:capsular exopolysaccharide synthesis family protein